MRALTPDLVHSILQQFFPAQNDTFECDYREELNELHEFGITTAEQLMGLLQKRTNQAMEIDRSPMSDFDIRVSIEAEGEDAVQKRLQAGFWFSFPALLRISLELEFGKAYEDFSKKRDRPG